MIHLLYLFGKNEQDDLSAADRRFLMVLAAEVKHAPQTLFALYLNVHPNTIRSWEQSTRKPKASDLKLLAIAKSNPQALLNG